MSIFNGTGHRTGEIGICAQCRNKSEISVYPNDNPDPICESCYRDNQRLEMKISEKASTARPVAGAGMPVVGTHPASSLEMNMSAERERYISVIIAHATDAWLDKFIQEVLVRNVLRYDWKEIIKFDRWFSVLDLRRFALDVAPDFEITPSVQHHVLGSADDTSSVYTSAHADEPKTRKPRRSTKATMKGA